MGLSCLPWSTAWHTWQSWNWLGGIDSSQSSDDVWTLLNRQPSQFCTVQHAVGVWHCTLFSAPSNYHEKGTKPEELCVVNYPAPIEIKGERERREEKPFEIEMVLYVSPPLTEVETPFKKKKKKKNHENQKSLQTLCSTCFKAPWGKARCGLCWGNRCDIYTGLKFPLHSSMKAEEEILAHLQIKGVFKKNSTKQNMGNNLKCLTNLFCFR